MRKCDKKITGVSVALVFRQALVLVLVAGVAALASAFFHRAMFSRAGAGAQALASDETTWAQVAEWQRAAEGTQGSQAAEGTQAAQATQTARGAPAPRILILDARPDEVYRAAHVPGALPLNEPHWERLLPAVIEALGDNTRVVVYCDDRLCEASRGVATRLRRELALDAGDVFVLKGGWHEWQQTHPAQSGGSILLSSTETISTPSAHNPAPAR